MSSPEANRVLDDAIIRVLDIALAAAGLIATSPFLLVSAIAVGTTSKGGVIFAQKRVGRRQKVFTCYKLRTMKAGTKQAASHEVGASSVTSVGAFLRRTKLDELPQLWNVLTGAMSLVGPRPCLPTQTELVEARARRGVYELTPGITGIAQVQGVDMSDPERLARLDEQWIEQRSVGQYLRVIFLTVAGRGRGDRVGGG